MKINKLEMKAVIPTRQYENIQPSIEISDVDLNEGTEFVTGYINGLINRFSEHGALVSKNATTTLKSFNEDVEIEFDPINHVYTFNGHRLLSATTKTAGFYKKFDKEAVSKHCEKAWKVPAKDIVDMWEANGDVAATFGNAIHKALEYHINFNETGEKISETKGENPAVLKHPLIRGVVNDFLDLYDTLNFEGDLVAEALVSDTEKGVCGLADRILVTGEKKCRIQDYKVNVESEEISSNLKAAKPFNELPANKITKYQIQMSIYANMLQNSGWEVEGLDVFVFEDEWKHYEMDVLNVL